MTRSQELLYHKISYQGGAGCLMIRNFISIVLAETNTVWTAKNHIFQSNWKLGVEELSMDLLMYYTGFSKCPGEFNILITHSVNANFRNVSLGIHWKSILTLASLQHISNHLAGGAMLDSGSLCSCWETQASPGCDPACSPTAVQGMQDDSAPTSGDSFNCSKSVKWNQTSVL